MNLSDYTDEELKKMKPGYFTERELREELLRRSGAKMTPNGWTKEGEILCVHGRPFTEICNCSKPLFNCPHCTSCWCM